MTCRSFIVFAILAVLAGGLAACSPSKESNNDPGASPEASADAQQALEIGRRFAQCARDHGYPTFPDPAIDGTKLIYGDGSAEVREQSRAVSEVPECKAIEDQLRALSDADSTPSAADLQKLKQFAQCLRDQGFTGWPDPKADGTFPIIGTPLEPEAKSDRSRAAHQACEQHWDRGIRIS